MKDDDAHPISKPTSSSVLTSSSSSSPGMFRKESSVVVTSVFGRTRYKFWALAAILLLAFWSMLTGTASLRWSTGNLNRFDQDYESPAAEDLDVLVIQHSHICVFSLDFFRLSVVLSLFVIVGSGGEGEIGEAHVGRVHQQPSDRIGEFLEGGICGCL